MFDPKEFKPSNNIQEAVEQMRSNGYAAVAWEITTEEFDQLIAAMAERVPRTRNPLPEDLGDAVVLALREPTTKELRAAARAKDNNCPICPPNRGENANRSSKYGKTKKPKSKGRRGGK